MLAGEGAGMASISGKAAVGRLLGAAGRGVLGPWGMAAITAAQLCYSETDWKIVILRSIRFCRLKLTVHRLFLDFIHK